MIPFKKKWISHTIEDDPEVLKLASEAGAWYVYQAVYDTSDYIKERVKRYHELKGKDNRKARFRTVIALILDGKTYYFEGIVNGTIVEERKGTDGFGYDPIFIPEGYTKTFAELGVDIKNQISHRALAVNKLISFLSNLSK